MAKHVPAQLTLFPDDEPLAGSSLRNSTTFGDNLALPVHRWFRYSAGFSARWVRQIIQEEQPRQELRVLDPFAGSGTVLIEADDLGVPSIGIESHPFVARIARIKTHRIAMEGFDQFISSLLKQANQISPEIESYPVLIRKCYPDETLAQLDRLRRSWLKFADAPHGELAWLALTAILRQCSPVGTANWQYVLPNKTKARTADPLEAFRAKARQIALDSHERRTPSTTSLIQGDAREMRGVPDGWASLVITSPPYPNNFDYADATRLEMSFFGEIAGWGDLQDTVRQFLVRSCTQHVSPIVSKTQEILASTTLDPIREEIEAAVQKLDQERHQHGGKKNYHTMIAAYFLDMAAVWNELRRVTSPGARICYVIGDSAPYGIHIPVDDWMGRLAIAAGFSSFSFLKTRDRNTKWKNRKHRVPLHEGQLWVEG